MTIDIRKYEHCQPAYPVKRKWHGPEFMPRLQIPKDFPVIVSKIRELEAELGSFVLSEKDYFDLVIDAYSSNVHYSTEIEGNPLSLKEVKRVTRNSFSGKMDEAEADGPIQEILSHLSVWLFPDTFALPWTVDNIAGMHEILFGFDRSISPGQYREGDDDILTSVDFDGEPYFFPAVNSRVKPEMQQLVHWVNNYSTGYSPLAAAPVIYHELESIHPFYNGNGRLGRVLLHGYLANNGFPNSSLCKIEYQMLKNRELYYDILAWTDQEVSYINLIDYSSRCILKSYEDAVKLFSAKNLLDKDLNETTKRILIMAKKNTDWFRVSDAVKWTGGMSSNSVRGHLNKLVELDALETTGQTQGKRYRFSNPIRKYIESQTRKRQA